MLALPYCGNFCKDSVKYSLVAILFQLYIDIYLTSCLAIFAIMLEITISFQRYLVVSNRNILNFLKTKSPTIISSVLFILSLLIYLPAIINFRIACQSNGLYTITSKYDNIYKIYVFIIFIFRGPFCTVISSIVNLMTLVKFRNQMKIKALITGTKRSELSLFVFIFISLLILIYSTFF
jgi:hypothetical protein